MTLPGGISTCTVTIGPAYSYAGEEGVITGTIYADRNVVWTATGAPIFKVLSPVTPSMAGGQTSFVVPHVDQAGFVDGAGNDITGWYYVFTGRATFGANQIETITKRFQVFVGQSTVDLDLVPDGPVIPGVTTPSGVVSSVAGLTGPVDGDDLVAALAGPLAASIADAPALRDTGTQYLSVGGCTVTVRRFGPVVFFTLDGSPAGGSLLVLPDGFEPSTAVAMLYAAEDVLHRAYIEGGGEKTLYDDAGFGSVVSIQAAWFSDSEFPDLP